MYEEIYRVGIKKLEIIENFLNFKKFSIFIKFYFIQTFVCIKIS